jgi:hypothetical protein
MTDPHLPAARDHATHDRLLVAGLADRRDDALAPSDLARARAQVASCPDCGLLLADLLSVAAASPSAAMPARPRDFTLTPADADRLRPRGLRRLVGLIGTSRDAFSRPLAIGLTTIGLAGLLVGIVPGALPSLGMGGAASAPSAAPAELNAPAAAPAPGPSGAAPAPDTAGAAVNEGGAQASAAASAAAQAPAASVTDGLAPAPGGGQPAASDDLTVLSGAGEDATESDTERVSPDDGDLFALSDEDAAGSPLIAASGLLLLAGLVLFVLRWSRRQDPPG